MTITLDGDATPEKLARDFASQALRKLAEQWLDSEIERTKGEITIREIARIGFVCGVEFHPELIPMEAK